jgi:hypothetical protein
MTLKSLGQLVVEESRKRETEATKLLAAETKNL